MFRYSLFMALLCFSVATAQDAQNPIGQAAPDAIAQQPPATPATQPAEKEQVIGENLKPPHLLNRDKSVTAPPQVDKEEVQRRGNMVQPMGVIEDGPIDLIADSLKPPVNDSDKWFIFVITKDGDAKSELLKQHFGKAKFADGTDNPLQAWAKPADSAKSYAHYNVIRIEDSDPQRGVFKDWFSGIRNELMQGAQTKGYPVVIMQPPKNGKYGPNKTVIAMVFGYDGNPASLAAHLGFAQKSYVSSLVKSGKLHEYIRAAAQRDKEFEDAKLNTDNGAKVGAMSDAPAFVKNENVGARQQPPFVVPPQPINPLYPINPGGDIPPMPQYLTLEQVQQLCPGAPADYIIRIMQTRPTVQQAQQIALQWQQDQNKIKPDNNNSPSSAPSSFISGLLGAAGMGGIAALIGGGLVLFRNFRKASGQQPFLDDAKFYYILQLLGYQLTPQQNLAVMQAAADNNSPLSKLPPANVLAAQQPQPVAPTQ